MSAPRVVVTGVGLTTALGATRDQTWDALLAGKCGIGPVTVIDSEGFRSKLAAEVPMNCVDRAFTPLERRRLSRADRIGVHAAAEAVQDAGLLDSGVDRTRVGVFLGAGTADLIRSERFYNTWKTRGIDPPRDFTSVS